MVRLLDQMICTGRKAMFELHKGNKSKIGMNMNEKKFVYEQFKIACLQYRPSDIVIELE